mmetsp:Transcript_9566/g.12388  ORF Transcript_9566/g.12388 Transcript_9566/m.12388 type:complete len:625 (+) Transcript_9566:146-2020(+)
MTEGKKPIVGVVGAGIAGLATAKELKDVGIDCEVYEMMPVIGGVFAHYGWQDGKLTSSSAFTWFSDFPTEHRQRHMRWPEWLDYLSKYVEHNKIGDRFNFNCKVLSVEKNTEIGGWDMTIHRKNWSNGHWTHPKKIDVKEETFTKHYDFIVMGSGLHHGPSMPKWEGAEGFEKAGGVLIHSSKFRNAEDYVGKNVIVVGAGESGSDIAWLTSKVCKKMTVSMRSSPGTLFPHEVNGNTADIRDNRIVYSLPRPVWPMLLKGQKTFFENIKHESNKARQAAFKFAAKSNFENRNCIYTINACKSFGIPKAVCFNNAEVKPMICHFEGRDVHFVDGSVVKDVDVVVAATGFKVDIPAMKDKELKMKYSHPRLLWNNMCAVDEQEFFLVGFCRPHQINLITCCEMQARTLSQIVSGRKSFPSVEEMQKQIDHTVEHMAHTFERGYKALVDFIPFCDGMARFIGCQPNYLKVMFTDPKMFIPMMFAPFQPSQYRLVGPGAAPEKARETILKSPYYQWPKERIARDTNVFLVLMVAGFADLFNVGGKHFRIQGQLRPLFKFLAAVYSFVIMKLYMFDFNKLAFGMFFLMAAFANGVRKGCDAETFLADKTQPWFMRMASSNAVFGKKVD